MKQMEISIWRIVMAFDEAQSVPLAKPSDVVPVTGLVFSKLWRLDNEHRTALEHWSRSK